MTPIQMLMMGGSNNRSNYGYLYNTTVTNDILFMPTDWELPSYSDVADLITFLGGSSVAGGHLKEAGLDHWQTPNTGADNTSGFTAFGGGRVDGTLFRQINQYGFFAPLIDGDNGLTLEYNSAVAYQNQNADGKSARAIYKGAGSPTTVTDYEGNVYDVVNINGQLWTLQNWKCRYLSRSPFTAIPNVDPGVTSWSGLATMAYAAYDNDESNV